MQAWFFDSPDPEQTFERAAQLGRSIGAGGLTLALVGPLGAGKTVFVKGLAEGLGIDPRAVSSPTFVIAQQYPIPIGPEALHHVDLYRLESAVELESIGFDDMLAGGQVLAVEWADRFPEVLGSEFLRIEFEGPSPAEEDAAREGVAWRGRRARVTAHGDDAERILADWAQRIEAERSSCRGGGEGGDRSGGGVSPSRFVREARVLLMLILGIAVFGSNQFALDRRGPGCDSLIELDSDALGTLRVRCAGEEQANERTISGIARLLDGQRVDLNRASVSLLRALPQIGPSRADAIVRARADRAERRFARIEDLSLVPGIGPRTLARVERWLYVGPPDSDSMPSASRGGRDD
jgi:tRNA threonylcarbamoyladenosine biosynthesis protein TsaE